MEIILSYIAIVVTGLIGFHIAMRSQEKAHEDALKRKEQQQKEELRAFLHSINTEINMLAYLYKKVAGPFLDRVKETTGQLNDEDLEFFYMAEQEYFCIYHQNAQMLGKINDDSFRDLIVTTYSKAKMLLDGHSLYNLQLREKNNFVLLYAETGKDIYKNLETHRLDNMKLIAMKIAETHEAFIKDLEALNKKMQSAVFV